MKHLIERLKALRLYFIIDNPKPKPKSKTLPITVKIYFRFNVIYTLLNTVFY